MNYIYTTIRYVILFRFFFIHKDKNSFNFFFHVFFRSIMVWIVSLVLLLIVDYFRDYLFYSIHLFIYYYLIYLLFLSSIIPLSYTFNIYCKNSFYIRKLVMILLSSMLMYGTYFIIS
ncbi:MAG: hypothetical protein CR982_10065 [Candidatus Cloacimonadota bacterium]|nr:MAG: hypothetical protein CR982_10065 [Candidatus Cloacimonadota bacterium]PIE79035.1 MAG: hypothetical protein CSA15_04645 [Candidatus Delongbacteria bacterium]